MYLKTCDELQPLCSDDESEGGGLHGRRKVAIDGGCGGAGDDRDMDGACSGVVVNYPRSKRHSTGDVASEVAPFRSSLLARAAEAAAAAAAASSAAAADSSPPSTADSTPLVTSPPLPLLPTAVKRRLQSKQRNSSLSLPDAPPPPPAARNALCSSSPSPSMRKSQTTITDI